MHSLSVVLVVGVCFGYAAGAYIDYTKKQCPIISTNKTEQREPLYLTKSTSKLSLYQPNNGPFYNDHEQIIIACPNPRNQLVLSSLQLTPSVCTNGKLDISQKFYQTEDLQCNKSIRGDIQKTTTKCGDNSGYLYNIGYKISAQFLTLFQVCYDDNLGVTYYSDHKILGASIQNASKAKYRPGFSTQGMTISANVAYKQVYNRGMFSNLLGSSSLVEKYINSKSFLSRGHLAPDADFHFSPWQYATYFYMNVCPQWQSINGGNWHKVESMVRKAAGHYKEDLRVLTGTHEVLTLPNVDGVPTKMFLLPKGKLPIPKFTWKILQRSQNNEAIVIVTLNNPFVTNQTASEYLCRDICSQYGWNRDGWQRPEKGLVHCCEYNEFARVVTAAPKLHVKGILHGPKRH